MTHPVSSIQHPASSIEHPVSSIEHPVSSIRHPASSIEYRASSIQHPASSEKGRAMAFDLSKFIGRFTEEAREHIKNINESLVNLEKVPDDTETLNAIFRSAHTIKGGARMLKLNAITEVAHHLEDVFDALRVKRIILSKEISDLLFNGVDVLSSLIEKTAAGESLSSVDEDLCNILAQAAKGEFTGQEQKAGLRIGSGDPILPEQLLPGDLNRKKGNSCASEVEVKVEEAPPSQGSQEMGVPKPPATREIEKEVPALPPTATKATQKIPEAQGKIRVPETIRVSAEKLDDLIKLVGEIISSQSRLRERSFYVKEAEKMARELDETLPRLRGFHNGNEGRNDDLALAAHSLYLKIRQLSRDIRDDTNFQEILTNEIQETALKMRMLPLSTIFDTFPRTIRDISRSLGKEVDFIVEGGETELDKKMIEKLGDPLLHMIRNSIDHGIETPEERTKAGKSAKGMIKLASYYEGGSVIIQVSDDGAGISLDKIKEKALQKRILNESELNDLSEPEIINLTFQPGFSTSEIITDVSGRGVGLDVVKKNIVEELKGATHIETKAGKGTSFYLRLPMTLAVVRVLLVTVANMTFAIPSNFVTEILRIPEKELIDVVAKKAIRLREQLIPIVNLEEILAFQAAKARDEKGLLILIASIGSENMGLVIDSLIGEEDMVIKPLPSHMKTNQWVSGVVISGKNELIAVLHIPKVLDEAKELKGSKRLRSEVPGERKARHILVVEDSLNTREIEKNILEAYGYEVTLAIDGQEALEILRGFKPDLIITDIEMPRLDGFTLTEQLRKDETFKHTPVILLTSRDKEEDKRRGIRVGANAYIMKGAFDQSNLLDTIQHLIG